MKQNRCQDRKKRKLARRSVVLTTSFFVLKVNLCGYLAEVEHPVDLDLVDSERVITSDSPGQTRISVAVGHASTKPSKLRNSLILISAVARLEAAARADVIAIVFFIVCIVYLGWFVRGNVITRGNQNRLDEMLNKGLHYL